MSNIDREKRREYARAWKAKNPDKVKAMAKRAYEKRKNNPDYIAKERAYHAEWQRKNKDKLNAYNRERRRNKKECPKCKHFVGCERAYHGICNQYEEDEK